MSEYSARWIGRAQRAWGGRVSEGACPVARLSLDPTTADDDVLVVEYDRLPRRHRRLRIVELELRAMTVERADSSCRRAMTMTDLGGCAQPVQRSIDRNPVHIRRGEGSALE